MIRCDAALGTALRAEGGSAEGGSPEPPREGDKCRWRLPRRGRRSIGPSPSPGDIASYGCSPSAQETRNSPRVQPLTRYALTSLTPNLVLPALTSAIGFLFTAVLLERFVRRRQPHYGVWTLGLLWYALAAGSEAVGAASGWTPALYRTWYITGAICAAAYLGAGTVYLQRRDPGFGSLTVVCVLIGCIPALATRHAVIGGVGLAAAAVLTLVLSLKRDWFAHAAFAILVVTSVAASIAVLNASIDTSLLPTGPDQVVSGQAFDPETRALTPGFNIAGAAILVLGAALSTFFFWRSRAQPQRVVSTLLIASGAFVPSLASGLTRFGVTSVFFLGELVGLVLIVAGFLLSGSIPKPFAPRQGAKVIGDVRLTR